MRRGRIPFLLIIVLMTTCSKKVETTIQNNPSATQDASKTNTITKQSEYKEVQLDFSGHSSEGGFIIARFDRENRLIRFEVYILSERGKVVSRCDLSDPPKVAVVRTDYKYEESISDVDGDVKIASQIEKAFVIQGENQISPHDEGTLEIYKAAMNVINANTK